MDTLSDHIFGPVVVCNRQITCSVASFLFLVNDLAVFLEHVPLHQQQHIWFMYDGAPPHFLPIFRQHLNQTFGEKWIGWRRPVNWPAHSPDFNTLDFWLWGLWCSQRRSMI
jgi:hypothetical protein